MKNILKQFGVWATPSSQNNFRRAVILLTGYYTVGVFIVLAIFNITVYGLFTNSIHIWNHENKERSLLKDSQSPEELGEVKLEEIQNNLAENLLTADLIILLITVIVAYFSSKRTLAPIERAYKNQARFVADAAHELRTPLSVMKAGSEVILRKNRSTDEYIKFINESLEEIKRLTTLSNDLLFLAQNNKKRDFLISKISLSEICEKQTAIMQAYANIKKVTIKELIDPGIIILGNKDDLIRLVINLLKNAVDYNKMAGNVIISLKKTNNNIMLSIADNGIGIKKEDFPYVFERFYKADNSRTQNSSSTGLGLSIIKEIVDEHKGQIKIESVLGQGTTFIVIFPG